MGWVWHAKCILLASTGIVKRPQFEEQRAEIMEKRVSILVVDDEQDEAQLILENLQCCDTPPQVQVVDSGEEAIAYLAGEGKYADREAFPFPFLVLLDLRMPGVGGFGVLRWLCAHQNLKQKLNLVVLSSVQSSKEIEVVYELGAQFFWPKTECGELQERVQRLQEAWHDEK
jgi:CheY-like chemotaxis protein